MKENMSLFLKYSMDWVKQQAKQCRTGKYTQRNYPECTTEHQKDVKHKTIKIWDSEQEILMHQ